MAVTTNTSSIDDPITIKKYANRRLYNTATSSYVTLDHLCSMVKEGKEFQVVDAKTGEDITRSVLTQIIFEEENKGPNLLPIQFLRQLIKFYGNNMEAFLPSYLELSMEQFTSHQEQLRENLVGNLGGGQSFGQLEDHIRQNMAIFERSLRMFSPFSVTPQEDEAEDLETDAPVSENGEKEDDEKKDINKLKDQLAIIQAKLEELSRKS